MKKAHLPPKPGKRPIARNLLEVPLTTALANLAAEARSLMAEPGDIQSLESRFTALCLQVLGIHHGLEVEHALSLAGRLWSEALDQGSVSKRHRKAHTRIPDVEQSDYKEGCEWVFDDALELHRGEKVSIEGTVDFFPSEDKVTFGTSAHDDMLTAEQKTEKGGRHYILVRRATIDEEAATLGRSLPNRGPRRTRYPNDGAPTGVTPARLKRLPRARQIDIMREWFRAHYADVSGLSGEQHSEEPYAAIDVLWSEFDGVVQEHVIRDLADELDEQAEEWLPVDSVGFRKDFLLKQIQLLRDELERLDPLYGRLGHNNPPEDTRLFPIGWEDRGEVLDALEKLEDQAKSERPDEVQVKASTSALRSAAIKVWEVGKRKADKATDKMAENIGLAALLEAKDAPAIYHWIVDTASSLYGKLEAVIQAADLWLKSLHLLF
jgi:hypothetical protein